MIWPQKTVFLALILGLGLCASVLGAQQKPAAASVRAIRVLGGRKTVEVEITASQPVTPKAQMVSDPDRLVLDFPNSVPGSTLKNVILNRGEVRGVRAGLFSADPPVTRVVLDLASALTYQLFPSGNTVIVKLSGGSKLVETAEKRDSFTTEFEVVEGPAVASEPPAPPAPPAPKVKVSFRNGKLSIWAERATLAEVLYEVGRKTGADIPIPASAAQDQVVTQLGPAPAREVLASLLNGTEFNFVMIGAADDPARLSTVLLTPKGGGAVTPIAGTYTPPPAPGVQRTLPQVVQPPLAANPTPPDEEPDDAESPQ